MHDSRRNMKLLALTDIHGSYDTVRTILTSEQTCSAVILGGDLTTRGSVDEARRAVQEVQRFGKPVFAVAGNMDPVDLDDAFDELGIGLNAKGLMLDDIGLFGVSASPFTPMHTPYEISEEEIALRAHTGWKDVQAARATVFVPHAPPRDTKVDTIASGAHVGSTAVRRFIEQFQPSVVICGHIHEARGTDSIGASTIVNCGPAGRGYYAVITIGKTISVELKG